MASAAMIHSRLDLGKFVCFLSGEYTGQYRDVRRTLDAVRGHVNTDDYNHIKRILMDGCPAQLTFEEPSSNKVEFISRGNSKNFNANPKLVRKTMNKEDRYSHLVPMDPILCKFSPYLCHTTQSIVIFIKRRQERLHRLGWLDGLEAYRYCYEPDNSSWSRITGDFWPRETSDLHWYLQYKNQLSDTCNTHCSGRHHGLLSICKDPRWFNRSIWFSRQQSIQPSYSNDIWFDCIRF
jgi:hypothetical protein